MKSAMSLTRVAWNLAPRLDLRPNLLVSLGQDDEPSPLINSIKRKDSLFTGVRENGRELTVLCTGNVDRRYELWSECRDGLERGRLTRPELAACVADVEVLAVEVNAGEPPLSI
jgi:hypothetical protein